MTFEDGFIKKILDIRYPDFTCKYGELLQNPFTDGFMVRGTLQNNYCNCVVDFALAVAIQDINKLDNEVDKARQKHCHTKE